VNIGDKALQVLKTFAPTVATALGGPLAGAAVAGLEKVFGTTPGDDKALNDALLAASPEQMVAMRKVEDDFQVQMKQLGVTEEQLEYADTASARAREEVVKDNTPMILAYTTTIGFFGILFWMLIYGAPKDSDVLLVMLGALGSAWTAIVAYYFGSSLGARKGLDALTQIAKQP